LKGKMLHELWTEYRPQIFGDVPDSPRFPLLIKLLDAQERLSVQVHPPAAIAPALKGEPKTEMWYFADCSDDADIFAGLKRGVTRENFQQALQTGDVSDLVHRIPVKAGQAIFIPSGRIHAIGAGNVIVEVQQNSDTTYRVFDWNRVGSDGHPRQLHVRESLESIDFDDFEPALATRRGEVVVECDLFRVEQWDLNAPREAAPAGQFALFTALAGEVHCGGVAFEPGEFFLVPATMKIREIAPSAGGASVLRISLP
jgi:mannose-6-phosphate isomerase